MLPPSLQFDPVPLRGRHDGWTPARQRLFILRLACGDGPTEAARRVGLSRQTAHAVRRKAGAAGFAAAWDAAQAFAHQARIAGRSVPPREYGFDTLFVPRFYRGKLVGFVQREDLQSALRLLARLDRLSETALAHEGFDFDALVEQAARPPEAAKADEIPV